MGRRPLTERVRLFEGDCLDVLPTLADCSVDAVVTDPPYGLKFMGKEWDYGVPGILFWEQVLRVLKPGGHLLAFGGTRTHHRLMCAIEDAGFEIRDCLMWLYGTGFPKSLNIGKAIDRAATEPATLEAQQWDGWGTALKPAHEPIVLARKPLSEKTVAANVLKHGTGGINIDGCRVGSDVVGWGGGAAGGNTWTEENCGLSKDGDPRPVSGRWPANVILDEDAGAMLDEQSGVTGGASRFFYCAKATRKGRDAGLPEGARNKHPTVKPVALMRYLVRLVTPPGGVVCDPFMGSGSTGIAAVRDGYRFVGVELERDSFEVARLRVEFGMKNYDARKQRGEV